MNSEADNLDPQTKQRIDDLLPKEGRELSDADREFLIARRFYLKDKHIQRLGLLDKVEEPKKEEKKKEDKKKSAEADEQPKEEKKTEPVVTPPSNPHPSEVTGDEDEDEDFDDDGDDEDESLG